MGKYTKLITNDGERLVTVKEGGNFIYLKDEEMRQILSLDKSEARMLVDILNKFLAND